MINNLARCLLLVLFLLKSIQIFSNYKIENIRSYYYDKQNIVVNKTVDSAPYGKPGSNYGRSSLGKSFERLRRMRKEDIEGKDIVDFGCNEGYMLFAAKEMGARKITGIEYNPWCVEQAKKYIRKHSIQDAEFICENLENFTMYRNIKPVDTVFFLAVIDSSMFLNRNAVVAQIASKTKNALYFEGHNAERWKLQSHVYRFFQFMNLTDMTRFEYLGTYEGRVLIRFGRELLHAYELPKHAITTDSSESEQLQAKELYVYIDSKKNPSFGNNCSLIQYVIR